MSLELLKPYFVEQPRPLIGAETVQIILLREIHDYTVLRTEETRELNTVVTPLSIDQGQEIRRVAFLATKQKAAETRTLEQLLRTATREAKLENIPECYLKDNLCLACPRCALYGGTNTKSGKGQAPNIKHRIEYSTAFSLLPYEDIESVTTFNAIDDMTQTTGQALGSRYAVIPATVFASVITFRSASKEEFILAMKSILACKSYGAESRIGGDVRNTVLGIVAGWEEIITSLEVTLECYDNKDNLNKEMLGDVLKKYKKYAGNSSKINILSADQLNAVMEEISNTELTKGFLEKCYKQVDDYCKTQKVK